MCESDPDGSGSGPAAGGCCRGFPPSGSGELEAAAVCVVGATEEVEAGGDEAAAAAPPAGEEEVLQETSAAAAAAVSSLSPADDTSQPSPFTDTQTDSGQMKNHPSALFLNIRNEN